MLKIGWSKRDVSTERPVMINGQMHIRISKGVLDPILLNCLVIEDGKVDEVDCCYGDCKFQCSCPIAQNIDELLHH